MDSLTNNVNALRQRLDLLPMLDVVAVTINAVPSTTITVLISSARFRSLLGMVQIASSCNSFPTSIESFDSGTMRVTYSFGADINGNQHFSFLLVGKR